MMRRELGTTMTREPEAQGVAFTTMVPKSLRGAVKAHCLARYVTMRRFVVAALRERLEALERAEQRRAS